MADMKQIPSFPGPQDIHRREFPTGATVLVRENFSAASVVIEGVLRVGAADVPGDKAGLSSFTASSLTRGTQQRTFQQIYEEIESLGASIGVSGGMNASTFDAKCLAEDLPQVLGILADVLQQPTFPPAEIEKERGEILTALEERAHSTRSQASLKFYELLYSSQHPYGRSTQGYIETIRAITRDELERFYRRYYGPRGLIVSIVGAVPASQAVEMWDKAFGAWRAAQSERQGLPPVAPISGVSREFAEVPGKFQSDIVMGCVGPSRLAPDYLEAAVANSVLGVFGLMGRLGSVVREKLGLAYYATSRVENGLGPGAWKLFAGVDPANVQRAIESMQGEIRRLRDKLVGGRELADNKSFLTGSLPLQLETNDGVASLILDMELYGLGLDYVQRYMELVNAIKPKQIQAVARKYLDPDNIAVAVAGPKTVAG
ncbi:MAG: insulinase family protein [Thermoflexales bacterium]|nr:insulinase family protein [Thermoflexales bacterium]